MRERELPRRSLEKIQQRMSFCEQESTLSQKYLSMDDSSMLSLVHIHLINLCASCAMAHELGEIHADAFVWWCAWSRASAEEWNRLNVPAITYGGVWAIYANANCGLKQKTTLCSQCLCGRLQDVCKIPWSIQLTFSVWPAMQWACTHPTQLCLQPGLQVKALHIWCHTERK